MSIAEATAPAKGKREVDDKLKSWAEFHKFVGIPAPKPAEGNSPSSVKNVPNAQLAIAASIKMGLGEWKYKAAEKNFHKIPQNNPREDGL